MAEVTWDAIAETLRALALRARLASRDMDERRAALSRSALVWWQGEAAERYQRRVQDRVNGLAALSVRLELLALRADDLAREAEVLAAAERTALTTGRSE